MPFSTLRLREKKRPQHLLLGVCFILLGSCCFAQEKDRYNPFRKYPSSLLPKKEEGDWYLRIAPLSAIDILDNALVIGIEHARKDRWAYILEAGYYYASFYFNDLKKVSGLLLRPEIRHYDSYGRRFFSVDAMFKAVNYKRNAWVGMDCIDGSCAFEKLMDYNIVKQVYALNAKVGWKFSFYREGVIFGEAYIGLGFRYKTYGVKNVPPNSRVLVQPTLVSQNNLLENSFHAALPAGFKISVKL
jgi:hypothetical protein